MVFTSASHGRRSASSTGNKARDASQSWPIAGMCQGFRAWYKSLTSVSRAQVLIIYWHQGLRSFLKSSWVRACA